MKDKLRELVEMFRKCGECVLSKQQVIYDYCADQLTKILDAEGDGGAVVNPVALLTIELDRWYVEGIRMEVEALKVPAGTYKLYTHPARSGVVGDEDVEIALQVSAENLPSGGGRHADARAMRATLEHDRQRSPHDR